ncbi:MAG: glycerol-3-phosphate 1-O-acyltransferase PlsY [Alphaproteobacteria bacterium]|nr:glycerol-3-phosphate 1-O-acyltransferase PlsY [Alphaproteobacteria bacterium]
MPDDALMFALAALGGYLLGSVPFGLLLTRAAGLGDIRAIGSGNIGATNVLRTGRRDIALATLALDAGKAAAALLAARAFAGPEAGFVAGAAAFIGHCYPVWLSFKGGKGVATFFGVLFAGLWPVGLIAGAAWLITAFASRFSSLGALVAAIAAPIAAAALNAGAWAIGFCALLAALIYWRHRANIARLMNGTEPKIGAKKKDA